ncbi:unnamed protein product [Effrenium voratum]|nr:unnamed protein product [Effrenium voratum]
MLDFQIDDIVRPSNLLGTEGRLRRTRAAVQADLDGDGMLSLAGLEKVFAQKLPADEAKQLAKDVDLDNKGKVMVDQVLGWTDKSVNNAEFLDRFRMLESLKLPVLVSGVGSDAELSAYLARYTNAPIVLAVGGGNYDIARGIFNSKIYDDYNGGMLEAFGKLFAGNVRIYQYPNISGEGEVSSEVEINGTTADLHKYLVGEGKIVAIEPEYMTSQAVSKDSNDPYRGQSEDVVKLMQEGKPWEKYVPSEAAAIIKQSSWFQRYTAGGASSQEVIYKVFEVLDAVGA